MGVVTELITEFKFVGSEGPLNKYNASLAKGIGLLAGMTAAVAASGVAIASWTSSVLAGEQSLINLAAETGVAVERLQELRYIASVSNSDIGALDQSMVELSKIIGEAAQQGSEDFARLGISVRDSNGDVKNAAEVLDDVRYSFERLNLSKAEQQSFAQKLGIEPSLITMLNHTSGEMASLSQRARELGILTEEQTMFAAEYNDAMTGMRYAMDGVRRLVAVGLGPELKNMVEMFTDLLAKNRDWIVNGIKFAVGMLSDFMEMIGRVWPLLASGAAAFVALKVATLGWAGALGFLLSPAVLIAAGIAALLFVVDDLIVAFQGGQSVIRNFFLEFFGFDIQPVLQGIVDGFKDMFGFLMDIAGGFLASIGGLFSGIGGILTGNFSEGLDDLGAAFSIWIDTMRELFMGMFGGVFEWAKGALLDVIPDWMKDMVGIETKPPDGRQDKGAFLPGNTTQQTSNRSTQQDVQINVTTSDPVRAGEVTVSELQQQLDDAKAQTDRGGM